MLTVTWQLKPLIVSLHLLFGFTTLSLLWWLVLTLRRAQRRPATRRAPARDRRRRPTRALQARAPGAARPGRARSCRSRSAAGPAATTPPSPAPTCRPARAAGGRRPIFAPLSCLWRGLTRLNYEGGVLDNPARVAIQLSAPPGRAGDQPGAAGGRASRGAARPARPRGACRCGGAAAAGAAADHRHVDGAARLSAVARHGAQCRRRPAIVGHPGAEPVAVAVPAPVT